MSSLEVMQQLSKLKSGAPCTDYDKRDTAIEIAKKAIAICEERGLL